MISLKKSVVMSLAVVMCAQAIDSELKVYFLNIFAEAGKSAAHQPGKWVKVRIPMKAYGPKDNFNYLEELTQKESGRPFGPGYVIYELHNVIDDEGISAKFVTLSTKDLREARDIIKERLSLLRQHHSDQETINWGPHNELKEGASIEVGYAAVYSAQNIHPFVFKNEYLTRVNPWTRQSEPFLFTTITRQETKP